MESEIASITLASLRNFSPDVNSAIVAAANHHPAVGTEGHRTNQFIAVGEDADEATRREVAQAQHPIAASRHQGLTVGAEFCFSPKARMHGECTIVLSCL